MRRVYLDFNATSQLDQRILEAIRRFHFDSFGNPSSREHAFGWDAAEAVVAARDQIAQFVNAKPNEIIFTSGATEAINWALKGLPSLPIIAWATEHAAVLDTSVQVSRSGLREVEISPVDRGGRIDSGRLKESLCGESLVCLMLANNESGVIHPIEEAAKITHEAGGTLFCDLTQATGKIPIDVRALGIDLAAFSAHKFCGPKGVGALYIRGGKPKIELEPLIVGGGQERGLRGGTLNVPGIVGFGEACRIAKLEMAEESVRVGQLRDKLENTLLGELTGVWVNGDRVNRLYNTSNIGFGGVDARTLIRDMHDIAVSTRSACSSGKQGPSHVLKAMGLTDDEAYSSVRFSLGRFTTEEEIDYTIRKVIASVVKLRKR